MATPELDKLLVDHLADLESAAARLDTLGTEIFGEVEAAAEMWAREKGWLGHYDFLGNHPVSRDTHAGLWFAPPEWLTSGTAKQDFQAWFQLVWGPGPMDHFNLTALCREGSGKLGFAFDISNDLIQWKNLKSLFKDTTFTGLTEKTAFVVSSVPSFFFPIQLDATVLAKCLLEDDIEPALTPFKMALDSIAADKPAFDAVIAKATSHLPRHSPSGPQNSVSPVPFVEVLTN